MIIAQSDCSQEPPPRAPGTDANECLEVLDDVPGTDCPDGAKLEDVPPGMEVSDAPTHTLEDGMTNVEYTAKKKDHLVTTEMLEDGKMYQRMSEKLESKEMEPLLRR